MENLENQNNVLLEYYNVFSQAWYDSKDEKDIYSLEKAIEYGTDSDGYFPPYKLSKVTIYKDEKDNICKRSQTLGILPNRSKRTIEYYILGTKLDDETPEFLSCLSSGLNFDPDNFDISNYEKLYNCGQTFEKLDNIGIYKVACTLGDDGNLSYNYEMARSLKGNRQLR